MQSFREALEECWSCDLGYTGRRFTWSNIRNDKTFTKEWLDRAVANIEWCCRFQEVTLVNLATRTSDHSPVLVSFRNQPPKP